MMMRNRSSKSRGAIKTIYCNIEALDNVPDGDGNMTANDDAANPAPKKAGNGAEAPAEPMLT